MKDDLTKGQRACIVLNAYEAEERRKARERQLSSLRKGDELPLCPNGQDGKGGTRSVLAKKAGVGNGTMQRLIEVKRKRPDLFQRVFNGEYTIGKAHAEMKRDESIAAGT